MAINYNINPYAAGAVVFDQRPFFQFYQQQAAQRQAKEAALDNYFRDLGKNITPTGMRSQDVEGLTKRANEWRQFYVQNKAAITNPRLDNGQAYTRYMAGYQDQLGYINESKNELNKESEFDKLRLDPNRSWILDDPDIMNKYKRHTLPLDDVGRQSLNLAEMTLPPKPWDIKDQAAHSAYLTHGLEVDKIPGQPISIPGFKTRTPITKQYGDASLQQIAQKSGDAFDINRSLQHETVKLARQVENDPIRHNQMNSIFKRVVGRDIQELRDFRIAQDLLNENRKSIEYKEGEDVYGRQLALENIRFGHQRQLKKEEQKIANDWVINYWNTRIGNAKSGQPTPFADPNNPLTIKMGYEIEPDGVMMKGLARNGVEPDAIYVTVDNKIMPIFYKYKPVIDEKGNVVTGAGSEIAMDDNGDPIIDKALSKPMKLDQAYLSLGYRGETKKQLAETMGGVYDGEAKPQPQNKIEDFRKKYNYYDD